MEQTLLRCSMGAMSRLLDIFFILSLFLFVCVFSPKEDKSLKSGAYYLLYKSEWFAPLCVTVTVTVCHCCLEVELWLKC